MNVLHTSLVQAVSALSALHILGESIFEAEIVRSSGTTRMWKTTAEILLKSLRGRSANIGKQDGTVPKGLSWETE